jgi:hypothetical protein
MKFSIRDLLWLIVLAAVLTVWGLDHWRQAAKIQKLDEIVGPLQGAGVNRYYVPPNPSTLAPNPPTE